MSLSSELEEAYEQYTQEHRTVGEFFGWIWGINKEFIKKLKENKIVNCRCPHCRDMMEEIDKLAGPKLTKNE